MIVQARNKIPFIHLGFGKQELTVYKGEEIIVWQDELYLANEYDFTYANTGAVVVSEQVNQLVIKYETNGVKTVQTTINKGEEIVIESNIITINVVDITWASKEIQFNRTDITFNTL